MKRLIISAAMDRYTARALQLVARNHFDGNISLALRILVRKGAAEYGFWPLSTEELYKMKQEESDT